MSLRTTLKNVVFGLSISLLLFGAGPAVAQATAGLAAA